MPGKSPTKIAGLDSLKRAFNTLEAKASKNIARKAIRAGLNVIVKGARANAPVGATGKMRKAIKIKTTKRKKDNIRLIVMLSSKAFEESKFYPAIVEYGAKKKRKRQGKHAIGKAFDEHAAEATKVMEETGLKLLTQAMKTK